MSTTTDTASRKRSRTDDDNDYIPLEQQPQQPNTEPADANVPTTPTAPEQFLLVEITAPDEMGGADRYYVPLASLSVPVVLAACRACMENERSFKYTECSKRLAHGLQSIIDVRDEDHVGHALKDGVLRVGKHENSNHDEYGELIDLEDDEPVLEFDMSVVVAERALWKRHEFKMDLDLCTPPKRMFQHIIIEAYY